MDEKKINDVEESQPELSFNERVLALQAGIIAVINQSELAHHAVIAVLDNLKSMVEEQFAEQIDAALHPERHVEENSAPMEE
jgi:hypothetical protein